VSGHFDVSETDWDKIEIIMDDSDSDDGGSGENTVYVSTSGKQLKEEVLKKEEEVATRGFLKQIRDGDQSAVGIKKNEKDLKEKKALVSELQDKINKYVKKKKKAKF